MLTILRTEKHGLINFRHDNIIDDNIIYENIISGMIILIIFDIGVAHL